MTKIKLNDLTNIELIELISDASNELLSRESIQAVPTYELPSRDEAIQFAKSLIENLKDSRGHYNVSSNGIIRICKVDFNINFDKRTVTALLKGFETGKVYSGGRANACKDDVFNIYIGKAIALCRALNLPVPEILINHEQPTEIENGDIVQNRSAKENFYQVLNKKSQSDNLKIVKCKYKEFVGDIAHAATLKDWAILVDDSKITSHIK
jgi:hypothetical protein